MSTKQNPDKDDALDKVLRQWRVEAPLPPGFQEQVWRRIARAEQQEEPALWTMLNRLIEVLPRPKVALVYLAVFLAFGVAAGSLTAQARSNRMESALSLRYVQSIDPYRAEMTAP